MGLRRLDRPLRGVRHFFRSEGNTAVLNVGSVLQPEEVPGWAQLLVVANRDLNLACTVTEAVETTSEKALSASVARNVNRTGGKFLSHVRFNRRLDLATVHAGHR